MIDTITKKTKNKTIIQNLNKIKYTKILLKIGGEISDRKLQERFTNESIFRKWKRIPYYIT